MLNRKDFIRNTCIACIGGLTVGGMLEGCESTRIMHSQIEGSGLQVPLTFFEIVHGKKVRYKKYVLVQNEQLQFPICIFRLSATEYSALYMRCSHQGAELQVFGDMLQCPAHGSEFTHTGEVRTPPATESLRRFPVTLENNMLKVNLS